VGGRPGRVRDGAERADGPTEDRGHGHGGDALQRGDGRHVEHGGSGDEQRAGEGVRLEPPALTKRVEATPGSGLVLKGESNDDLLSTLIGNRATSVPGGSQVGLEATLQLNDPNETIQQHFVGYSFFTGTPGGSSGSLQGGSCESSVFNNGSGDIAPAVLGFEGIAAVGGDNGNKVGTAIGLQSTAFITGTQGCDNLIGFAAAGPRRDSGSGTVLNAYSVRIAEPAVTATNVYSNRTLGRTRLVKGTHANALEIANVSDTLQWASDGTLITGYASDGASARVVFDPGDAATQRALLTVVNGTTKGLIINDNGGSGTGNLFEAQKGGAAKFAVLGNGDLYISGTATTATPAAGGASALPATPAGYLALTINGVARKLVYY
jgi:hypothetical protein